jgi:hypothetical protein
MHTFITDSALVIVAVADVAAGFAFALHLNEPENEKWPT